jgi:hypothetical protein
MGFLYKAFIRKNSPELREKLEDLGYTNGAWETPCFHYPYLSVWPNPKFGLFKGKGFYMTEDDYRLDGKVWEYKPKEDVIDCGDNEELFLAIAALRDDTDYMQWFICQEEYISTHTMDFVKVGTWQLNTQHYKLTYGLKRLWRKSTVEELISHFK